MGYCDVVEVQEIGDTNVVVFRQGLLNTVGEVLKFVSHCSFIKKLNVSAVFTLFNHCQLLKTFSQLTIVTAIVYCL